MKISKNEQIEVVGRKFLNALYVTKGYVRLYVLKNSDLKNVLKDYPEAEVDMRRQLEFSMINIEVQSPSESGSVLINAVLD